jgi:hypothetical protein
VVLIEGVVKDNAVQPGKSAVIPIHHLGFQDDSVRPLIGCRKPFHQLIRARAPRALSIDHSPVLRAPADVPIELTIRHVHDADLRQSAAIWFRFPSGTRGA